MDWREFLKEGMSETTRRFRNWSSAQLLEQARKVPGMSDERDDMGHSERNVWAPALYRVAHLRLYSMQDDADHMVVVDAEWDREWDDLEQVEALVKDWAA